MSEFPWFQSEILKYLNGKSAVSKNFVTTAAKSYSDLGFLDDEKRVLRLKNRLVEVTEISGIGDLSTIIKHQRSNRPTLRIDVAIGLYFLAVVDDDYGAAVEPIEKSIFGGSKKEPSTFAKKIGLILPTKLKSRESFLETYTQTKIAGEGAEKNTNLGWGFQKKLSGQLTAKVWLDFRLGRRNILHPRQKGTKRPLPLVDSVVLHPVIKSINDATAIQTLISGEIATGKSSLVEIAVQSWQVKNPEGIVTIMPMSGDFSVGGGWQIRPAFEAFLKDAALIAKDKGAPHLIIIEDCHEFHIHPRSRYHFTNNVDLSGVSVIATTRPPYVDRVKADIEDWSGIRLNTIETNANETASKMIASSIENEEHQAQFQQVCVQLGGSLIALAAALFEATRGPITMIQPDLAYRAVREELERVFDPEGDHVRGRDIELLKTGLLAIWMLGAMECDFNDQDLARLLNVRDVSALIRVYEADKEIFAIDDDGQFRCARHPAWGQLTMRAVDEYERLDVIAGGLKKRILESANIETSGQLHKCLTAMLFGILFQRISDPDYLGFMSSGRHMHDEFAEAGRVFIENGRDRLGPITDRLKLLLQIGSSIRRSNPRDIDQRQNLLEQAGEIIRQAISLANDKAESPKLESLPGNVLYEAAYLHSLRGDLMEAKRLFAMSKENDIAQVGREQFGVMSGVRESIMLTYLGEIDAAAECLDQIEPVLTRLIEERADSGYMRFKTNLLHARLEVALARRDTTKARLLIDAVMEASEGTNSVGDRTIYDARVSLIEGSFSEAKKLADRAIQLSIHMERAESYATAYRVLGDSLLGLGKIKDAIEMYHALSTYPDQQLKYRDFEIQLVDDRLEKIQRGVDPVAILRDAQI